MFPVELSFFGLGVGDFFLGFWVLAQSRCLFLGVTKFPSGLVTLVLVLELFLLGLGFLHSHVVCSWGCQFSQ